MRDILKSYSDPREPGVGGLPNTNGHRRRRVSGPSIPVAIVAKSGNGLIIDCLYYDYFNQIRALIQSSSYGKFK